MDYGAVLSIWNIIFQIRIQKNVTNSTGLNPNYFKHLRTFVKKYLIILSKRKNQQLALLKKHFTAFSVKYKQIIPDLDPRKISGFNRIRIHNTTIEQRKTKTSNCTEKNIV